MKTEYYILWVDDELDTVADDLSDVEEFFEKYGIKAHIRTYLADETADIHSAIDSDLKNPELDLIVVDFKMNGMNGRELIDSIRKSDHIFLPVVFYSSVGVDALHKEAADAALDGVYISSRDRVRHKIQEVATSLLRKEQTSKRTRGLLMEGVSEIDANFGELFKRLWGRLKDDQKAVVVKYLREKLNDRSKDAAKAFDELPTEVEPFKVMMDAKFVSASFDTATRWKVIKKMLQLSGHNADSVKVFLKLFEPPADALIHIRNSYGHKTRAQLEPDHTEDKCIGIRRELRSQMGNLEKIIKETE